MQYISQLLLTSVEVVEVVEEEGRPVLVHCSDGWDRTTQVVSLAQILMDPHYRTIKVLKKATLCVCVCMCVFEGSLSC